MLGLHFLGAGGLALKTRGGLFGGFEFGFSAGRIDGAAEFGRIHQHGHLVGFHFGKATHQSDGGPTVAITQAHDAGVEGRQHGDVAGQDAHLAGGAGQNHLFGAAIENALIRRQNAQGETHGVGSSDQPLASDRILAALAFTWSMLPTR